MAVRNKLLAFSSVTYWVGGLFKILFGLEAGSLCPFGVFTISQWVCPSLPHRILLSWVSCNGVLIFRWCLFSRLLDRPTSADVGCGSPSVSPCSNRLGQTGNKGIPAIIENLPDFIYGSFHRHMEVVERAFASSPFTVEPAYASLKTKFHSRCMPLENYRNIGWLA